MDFGAILGNLATGAGAVQIATVEQEQRQATADNTKAEAQIHQMSALTMKQDAAARQKTQTEMASATKAFQDGAKTDSDILQFSMKGAATAMANNQFDLAKGYEEMGKLAEGNLKTVAETRAKEQAAASNKLGETAMDYVAAPSEAGAQALVDAAIKSGKDPKTIPARTDPAFASWAQMQTTEGPANEKRVEAMRKDAEIKEKQKETERADRANEALRLEHIQDVKAAQAQADATRQLAITTASADRARAEEARAARREQSNASARGSVSKHEGFIADLTIKNAAQGVRVIDNMMSVPGSAVQSLFTKIADGSLSGALTKAGGNLFTPEADQAVTAIGAEMGLVVGQVVTAGAGRGAALPIVESFQKMTTPQAGDSPMMKVLRIANAGEILRLELKNIVPGGTPELEESRKEMMEFLGKLPSTKQILKAMASQPGAEKEQTMGEYMKMMKQSTELTTKGKEAAAAEKKSTERTGETKKIGDVTYYKTASGGWEH